MKNRKSALWFYGFGAGLSVYVGYLLGAVYVKGITLAEFIPAFTKVMEQPFARYWSRDSPRLMIACLILYLIGIFMYLSSRIEFMAGKEYGTARFADPKQVNKLTADKDDSMNMILTQNVKLSMNNKKLKLNSNMLVVGGSGAGKSFYVVTPNALNLPNASVVFTDPKGELLGNLGNVLKKHGYVIKVLNLIEMDNSDCFNPFRYIRDETDIVKLITNLISNTTPKGANQSDPFWEKAESMFLQALMLYVWMEEPPERQNFNTLLDLLAKAEVNEDGQKSELDLIMDEVRANSALGDKHPAVRQYDKCVRGAGDTVRSIIISANSRLAFFENPKIKRIMSRDDMDLASIGIGKDGDGKTKTALFCVIPDSDKSYGFVVGMLYTLLFQTLYYEADFHYQGKLPVHVTFWLDEAANIPLPDSGGGGGGGYPSLLATMRSRNINSVTIVQNISQLKTMFKEGWEIIPGCSDEILYLGGNESESHSYFSKLLGKATINKRSFGETRGKSGSSSRNTDVLGRELMTPDEVQKMDNKKCLLFIRGFDPILDDKYHSLQHPLFQESGGGGGKWYVHQPKTVKKKSEVTFLNDSSYTYFVRQKQNGKNVFVNEVTMGEFLEISQKLEPEPKQRIHMEGLLRRISKGIFSEEQLEQVNLGIKAGLGEEKVLQYLKPEYSAKRMEEMRLVLVKEMRSVPIAA